MVSRRGPILGRSMTFVMRATLTEIISHSQESVRWSRSSPELRVRGVRRDNGAEFSWWRTARGSCRAWGRRPRRRRRRGARAAAAPPAPGPAPPARTPRPARGCRSAD